MRDQHWLETIFESPYTWGVLTLVAIALGFSPRTSVAGAWLCILVAAITMTAGVWFHPIVKIHRRRRAFTSFGAVSSVVLFFSLGVWLTRPTKPVAAMPTIASIKPSTPQLASFPFMVPGVWFLDGRWDFIINHRGDVPSYNVEMLFQDVIKQQAVLAGKTSLSADDINSYQTILRYPEVDPKGRGAIFAKQFAWAPPIVEHEKYAIEITWRDGHAHEDLNIERVGGKWFYAMKVENTEANTVLIDCMDAGFPADKSGREPCLPKYTLP